MSRIYGFALCTAVLKGREKRNLVGKRTKKSRIPSITRLARDKKRKFEHISLYYPRCSKKNVVSRRRTTGVLGSVSTFVYTLEKNLTKSFPCCRLFLMTPVEYFYYFVCGTASTLCDPKRGDILYIYIYIPCIYLFRIAKSDDLENVAVCINKY